MKVFAILQEPASYTVDRNHRIYDKLGIGYCYIQGSSEAKSTLESDVDSLNELSRLQLLKRLNAILRDNDVVIMNGYTGRVFRILFCLNKFHRKIIGIDSDTPLNIPKNKIKRLVKSVYLNSIFRDRKIYGLPGGTGSHRELFRHYGMEENRIFLMPMMVDNSRFITVDNDDGESFVFLYVGRIIDVKNIPTLIDAFVNTLSSNKNVELRIVGSGNLLPQFQEKYSCCRNIVFAGPKYDKDLVDEYKKASAFVLPSSFEPWGLVINEAMSAGLPVIVSDKVGARYDLVEGKDTGYIFKHDDIDDLAKKMELMVKDREGYKRMSENASRLMSEYWDYDLYEDCLRQFLKAASQK